MKNLQFWENFQIYIQKSQWKTDFLPIFSPIFGTFVILYTSGTYKKFWVWFEGGSSAGLGGYFRFGGGVGGLGGWGLYKPLQTIIQLLPNLLLVKLYKYRSLFVHGWKECWRSTNAEMIIVHWLIEIFYYSLKKNSWIVTKQELRINLLMKELHLVLLHIHQSLPVMLVWSFHHVISTAHFMQ